MDSEMVLTTIFMAANIIMLCLWSRGRKLVYVYVVNPDSWIEYFDDPLNATKVIIINLSAKIILRTKWTK